MLLIITPLNTWWREIKVYQFLDGSEAQMFEAFQSINELYDQRDERETVNIALVPITIDQLEDWIEHNIEPNRWEQIRRKIRCSVTTLARET